MKFNFILYIVTICLLFTRAYSGPGISGGTSPSLLSPNNYFLNLKERFVFAPIESYSLKFDGNGGQYYSNFNESLKIEIQSLRSKPACDFNQDKICILASEDLKVIAVKQVDTKQYFKISIQSIRKQDLNEVLKRTASTIKSLHTEK